MLLSKFDFWFLSQEVYSSPRKEVGVTKHGYLNKAPFHNESDGMFSGKVVFTVKVRVKYEWILDAVAKQPAINDVLK